MADLISYPFRLTPARTVATVDDTTEAVIPEAITMLVLTRRGELPMCPGFGITDPLYTGGLDTHDLQAQLDLWGPDGVTIDSIISTPTDDTHASADVTWSYLDPADTDETTVAVADGGLVTI